VSDSQSFDERRLPERDQTASDADQTGADLDQTSADADDTASERDQRASDRDQQSAERDQAASDALGRDEVSYAQSVQDRSRSARERDLSSDERAQAAEIRDQNAMRRDRISTERDAAATARDQHARAVDAEIELLEKDAGWIGNGSDALVGDLRLRAVRDRKRAGESRDRAATQRDAAAADREHAARDRAQASRDRASMSEQLVIEGIDHLTGALRRRTGMLAIKREMDRTKRSEEPLLLAFIDVDGLKIINDTRCHPAGDAVLRSVAECLREGLRSSDVILRFGGDEFICSLAGQDVAGGQQRMDEISAKLAEDADGQTISVGLAERRADESLDGLIVRADTAMIVRRNGT
jgi:diguanylate cyclase (GGDEF)-like protein